MKLPNLKSQYAMKPAIFEQAMKSFNAIDYAKVNALEPTAYATWKQDNFAVIPIKGMIFAEDNVWCWLFGGCALSKVAECFFTALNDPTIQGIILDINTPGGEVDGTAELAQLIYEARSTKPIVSYVSHMCCSAGYWLGAAASKIVLHESAEIGCIGVCAAYDTSEEPNVLRIVSSISPKKIPDINTDEGFAQLQGQVDKLGAIFLNNTAKYRGVDSNHAAANFGRGDVLIGNEAIAAGMADFVGTFKTAMATILNLKGAVMNNLTATKTAEMIDPNQITLDWLKQNRPDLVEEIKNEGVDYEQARQNEIDDVEAADIPEDEAKALRQAAKNKKGFTAGEFAKQVLVAQKKYRETQLALRNAEATAANVSTSLDTTPNDDKAKLLEAGKKAFNKMGR